MRKTWTKDDDDYVRKNYASRSSQKIADHLGRSLLSVYGRAKTLGVKKDKSYLASLMTERINMTGEKGRFKKGQKPWNKGLKIGSKGRTAETQFKKGNLPHSTLQDGCIRIRKDQRGVEYKYIRLSKANWISLHLHLWQQANGQVPKNHIVIFKDGNTMNTELDNLQCISKADNMIRNTIHRYPEKIKKSIRVLAKIKKQIRHAEK